MSTPAPPTPRLRTLIVDDEPLARRGLELRLARHPDVEIVRQCGNGMEALEAIAELEPDLLFLDVQMPELDGFATLKRIPASRMPLTVFVTAYDHYAIHAFEASAVDYVLKPIDDSRLEQALFRVRQQWREQQAESNCQRLLKMLAEVSGQPTLTLEAALQSAAQGGEGLKARLPGPPPDPRISFKDGGKIIRVDPVDIRWIDAAGDYMCIHAGEQTLVVRATLRDMEQRLDPQRFVRIHRSTLVNIGEVRTLKPHLNGEYFLELRGGQTLKLSRSYKDRLGQLGVPGAN